MTVTNLTVFGYPTSHGKSSVERLHDSYVTVTNLSFWLSHFPQEVSAERLQDGYVTVPNLSFWLPHFPQEVSDVWLGDVRLCDCSTQKFLTIPLPTGRVSAERLEDGHAAVPRRTVFDDISLPTGTVSAQ